jgi:hypothetical protein
MKAVWVVLALISVPFAAACDPGPAAAPPTNIERRPEIVGVVRSWDFWEGSQGRYTLSTGDVVDLNVNNDIDLPLTPRLSETPIYFPYGGGSYGEPIGRLSVLVLAGHDADGTLWYAAAVERGFPDCPFEIKGAGVYDKGLILHFSTGLVLAKDRTFDGRLGERWRSFPLDAWDTICVDSTGAAVSAEPFSPD